MHLTHFSPGSSPASRTTIGVSVSLLRFFYKQQAAAPCLGGSCLLLLQTYMLSSE